MSSARTEAEGVMRRREREAERHLVGSPRWWGWPVLRAVQSGVPLPTVLREWSLVDVWDHVLHAALGSALES
jgi:hypothetical protein